MDCGIRSAGCGLWDMECGVWIVGDVEFRVATGERWASCRGEFQRKTINIPRGMKGGKGNVKTLCSIVVGVAVVSWSLCAIFR